MPDGGIPAPGGPRSPCAGRGGGCGGACPPALLDRQHPAGGVRSPLLRSTPAQRDRWNQPLSSLSKPGRFMVPVHLIGRRPSDIHVMTSQIIVSRRRSLHSEALLDVCAAP